MRYPTECPECGKLKLVHKKSRIGSLCGSCAKLGNDNGFVKRRAKTYPVRDFPPYNIRLANGAEKCFGERKWVSRGWL